MINFVPRKTIAIIACFILLLASCSRRKPISDADCLRLLNLSLTESIIHDGFPPPVASRIYAYTGIAAYQSLYYQDSSLETMSGRVNGFLLKKELDRAVLKKLNPSVVLVTAYSKVAISLVYRGFIIEQVRDSLINLLKAGSGTGDFEHSQSYGNELANSILAWSAKDHYRETRDMPKFVPVKKPECWCPTPPTFADAIEPYWMMIRPFIMDSAAQFGLPALPKFDSVKGSAFYELAMLTYKMVPGSDSDKTLIARFWDCNPQRTYMEGHVMYNARQLTPGGHWLRITENICKKENISAPRTAYIESLVAMAIADGFIAAWNEKYRSDLVRPETYINRYIDGKWKPYIETPLFPEYPSAHSTISAAASTVLERFFGTQYAFTDSAEVEFSGSPRTFNSLREAADEAAISRIYGGIHYMQGCNEGKNLGNKIGQLALRKL